MANPNYRALFNAHLDPDRVTAIRSATNGNYALGNPSFQEEIGRMLERRVTPGQSGRPSKRRPHQERGAGQ